MSLHFSEHTHKQSAPKQSSALKRSKKMRLGADDVPDEKWRHFHKITPLSQAGTLWFVLLIAVYNFAQNYAGQGGVKDLVDLLIHMRPRMLSIVGIAMGSLLLITAIIVGFGVISWKKKTFALVESGIHFRSGIVIKQHIQMRWDRVQSVEIQQKLLGRIFGFGTVTVESAGNDDDIALGLLKMCDAAALRRELLGVVNRVRSGLSPYAPPLDDATCDTVQANAEFSAVDELAVNDNVCSASQLSEHQAGTGQTRSRIEQSAGEIPAHAHPLMLDVDDLERDELIYELPVGRMIASYLLSTGTIILLVAGIAGIVATSIAIALDGADAAIWAAPGFFAAIIPVIGLVWAVMKGAFNNYGTKLYISSNGLRKRSGLTKLTTSTYPPQRIHAISVSRPWLWKKAGWWQIRITKAGVQGSVKGSGGAANAAETMAGVLIPAATREEMLRILWVLLPGLGSENDAALLEEAFEGRGTGRWFSGSARSARWVSPIDWAYHGLALTPRAMLVRRKRFGREVQIIMQDHTQSLHLIQGPIARRCKIATLRADLVFGTIKAEASALPADQAWELLVKENELARQARAVGVSESLAEWKERVGVNGSSNSERGSSNSER